MSMLDQGFVAGGRCERRQLSARRENGIETARR